MPFGIFIAEVTGLWPDLEVSLDLPWHTVVFGDNSADSC
jgi:hypothetical protein